jgi:hypothetical protein
MLQQRQWLAMRLIRVPATKHISTQRHGASLLDKLTVMSIQSSERGLSVGGRVPSTVAQCNNIDAWGELAPQTRRLKCSSPRRRHFQGLRVHAPPHPPPPTCQPFPTRHPHCSPPPRQVLQETLVCSQRISSSNYCVPWSHTRRDSSTLRRASTRYPAAAAIAQPPTACCCSRATSLTTTTRAHHISDILLTGFVAHIIRPLATHH